MPEVPAHIVTSLKGIREGLHLRWNPTAVVLKLGSFDATGKATNPEYDPRWELWDVDGQGHEYQIMRLQDEDGRFMPPGDWLVKRVWWWMSLVHEHNADIGKICTALIDEPTRLRELRAQKDSDEFLDWVAKTASEHAKPKSAAALTYRGTKLPAGFSP